MSFSSDNPSVINQLPISIEFPKDPARFNEELTLWARRVANIVNWKKGGLHSRQEYITSEQYNITNTQSFKLVYRKTYDMVDANGGSIAPGATVSTPHGITNLTNGTNIYGCATNSDVLPNGPKRLGLPYASEVDGKNIEIYVDDLNVVIINGSTQTALTYCTIDVEYLKN